MRTGLLIGRLSVVILVLCTLLRSCAGSAFRGCWEHVRDVFGPLLPSGGREQPAPLEPPRVICSVALCFKGEHPPLSVFRYQ